MDEFTDLPKYEHLKEKAEAYPELQPRALEAWVAMLRIGEEVIGAGESLLADAGLSRGRFASLMVLHCRGSASPSDLAECAGVTRASMTSIVDSLERDGFAVREPSTEDRRMQQISLTGRGRVHLEELLPAYFSGVARLMSGLDESEQAQLTSLLLKLRGSVGRGTSNDDSGADEHNHLVASGGTHS